MIKLSTFIRSLRSVLVYLQETNFYILNNLYFKDITDLSRD